MSKQLSWILLGVLTVGVAATAGVAAHPPEEHAEPGPMHRLSIVAVSEGDDQPYEPNPYYQDLLLEFSPDPSRTAQPSKNYTFSSNMVGTCAPYPPYPTCPSRPYAEDELANIGEDFELLPTDLVSGNLRFSYEYAYEGIRIQDPGVIGYIDTGLQIGDDWYHADSIPLGAQGGAFDVPLSFHWTPSCAYDEENGTEYCQTEEESPASSANETWSHDVTMYVYIQGPYWYGLSELAYWQRLDISLDTSGGSFLDVPIPAPVLGPAAAESLVTVGHDDLGEDGSLAEPVPIYAEEGDDGTIYYAPGPALPLFLAAGLALAFLARRRFA